ncbi:hypothetical protein U0070_002119, partial [Myodes glareolus]
MSSPYTLQRLARKSLLKNEALANASLKKLPKTIFPPMFKDTFIGKQTNIVRAMVTAWPFPCLPVGSLMKTPNLKTLKAVLGGLDLLINQKDRPSKQLKYFYWWAMQRKDVVQVMCPKLEFGATPLYNPLMLLEVFDPSSIEEFAVNARWTLRTLVMIAPGLGQMKNFRKSFSMESSHLWSVLETERGENELKKIQHLQLNHVCFLKERLDQVISVQASTSIKHLGLSSVNFLNLDHLLLGSLLERLTATLQTLQLKGCIIMDFQISALLPALSQCTQLIEVNFLKNFLSVDSLKKLLLQHTAKLTLLTREIYPTPDEVYDDIGDVQPDRFSQHCCGDVDQCVKCPEDQYANAEHIHCIDKAVSFLSYEDPLGMALTLIALGFSALTSVVLGVFMKNHDTPLVKANNRNLSYTLLVSLIFCFLCPLLFIGYPNTAMCILQQITFGAVFTVAVSTVLAKTVTVLLAFKVTTPGRRMRYYLISGAPNFIIAICTLIQIILCAIWLGVAPPSIDIDDKNYHGHII